MKLKLIIAAVVACLLWSTQTLADSVLTISPPVQQLTLIAGHDQTFSTAITNHTAAAQDLSISAVDFGALDQTGGLYLIGQPNDFERRHGLANWIQLNQTALALVPGRSQVVSFTILNQSSLTPGGHYAAILFKSSTAEAGAQVNLKPVLTELVFVRKPGGDDFGLSLQNLKLNPDKDGLPQTADLSFRNTGNSHLTPRGVVRIIDPLGRTIERGVINEDSVLILPGASRLLSTALRKIDSAIVPGRYQVVVDYRWDGNDSFSTYQTSFIYSGPAKRIALAGAVLLAAIIAVIVTIVKRRRRRRHRAK